MTSSLTGSLSPGEKHRSPSPRSEFLAIPEFGSPNYNTSASSPTSLSVPGSWWGFGSTGIGGAGDCRRTSSAASSIFDLSAECEQLERALRDNDVNTVKKLLQLHHGRFPLDVHASFLDKSSCDSHSRRQSHVSQDVEILLRKSQTLIDSLERHRDSETTEEAPNIFRCSLHVAIQHNSIDVLKVLLKYGVDPNEPSSTAQQTRSRRSSQHSNSDAQSPTAPVTCAPNCPHQQCLQPEPCSHVPVHSLAQEEHRQSTDEHTKLLPQLHHQEHGSKCVRRLNDTSNSSFSRCPGNNASGLHAPQLPNIIETVVETEFSFATIYTKDELINLPCLFQAVVEGSSHIVQLLLRYGAQPNTQDVRGCSPLHLACSTEFHNLDVVRSLVKYGGRIHLKNLQGVSPFTLWPDILNEQRGVIRAALARVSALPNQKPRSRASTGTSHHPRDSPLSLTPTHDSTALISHRSGSISRFFKRLSSDQKARSRDRRITRDESSVFSTDAARERTYSIGSYRSQRSRHLSSCVQEDLESDISQIRILEDTLGTILKGRPKVCSQTLHADSVDS